MPNNKKKILLLLVLLLSCISYAGNPDKKKVSYGLTFQSHTVNQTKEPPWILIRTVNFI